GDERPQQTMNRREDIGIFDADRCQRVDVEEAPVVDLVGRRAPGREPIRLRLEQVVQLVEARRVTGRAVDPRHRGPDVRAYRLGSLYQREQTGACTSRVAATRLYRLLRAD